MTTVIRNIGRWFVGFISGINAMASFSIFLVLVFVCSDVIGRIFFNSPITGTSEIVKVGVVCVTFMQIPWALFENRHIRSDLVVGRLSEIGKQIAGLFRNLIGLAAFLFIFLANWKPMLKAWEILEYEGEGALQVPVYPLYTIIQLGSFLAALITIKGLVDGIREILANQNLEEGK